MGADGGCDCEVVLLSAVLLLYAANAAHQQLLLPLCAAAVVDSWLHALPLAHAQNVAGGK